jgi:hypothetical protein
MYGKRGAELVCDRDRPVLFAGRVDVMAAGSQRRLHHRPGELHERAGDVDDHLHALEQRQQRLDAVVCSDEAGIDRSTNALLDHRASGLETRRVATGHVERNVAGGEVLRHQLARVAAGPVDQHVPVRGHRAPPVGVD